MEFLHGIPYELENNPIYLLVRTIYLKRQNPQKLEKVPKGQTIVNYILHKHAHGDREEVIIIIKPAERGGTLVRVVVCTVSDEWACTKHKYIIVPNMGYEEFVKRFVEGRLEIDRVIEKPNVYLVFVRPV